MELEPVSQLLGKHFFLMRQSYYDTPGCSCGIRFIDGDHTTWAVHVAEVICSRYGHKITRHHREPE